MPERRRMPGVPTTRIKVPDLGRKLREPELDKPNLEPHNIDFLTLQCKKVDNGYVMVIQGVIKMGVGAGQMVNQEFVFLYKQDLYDKIGDTLDSIIEEAEPKTEPETTEPESVPETEVPPEA